MGKVWRLLLLALLLNSALSTAALARPVYLANGGIIEAQKVWQEEGRIYLLLNRDSLIDFSAEEINLKKTFAKKWKNAPSKPASKLIKATNSVAPVVAAAPVAEKVAVAATPAAKSAAAVPASAPAKATPAVIANAPVAAKSVPAATASAPAKTPPPVPASAPPVKTAQAAKVSPPPATAPAQIAPAPTTKKPTYRPPPVAAVVPQESGSPMVGVALLGVGLIFLLIIIASVWKVFEKAGEAGWKSLIPIYNIFVLLQISGCPSWWFLMFLLPVVNLYFIVVMYIRLAEKFGKSALFGFALCFLGFIFFPILAFGSATYGEEAFAFDEEEAWKEEE